MLAASSRWLSVFNKSCACLGLNPRVLCAQLRACLCSETAHLEPRRQSHSTLLKPIVSRPHSRVLLSC